MSAEAETDAALAIATAGSRQEYNACTRALAQYGKRIEAIEGSKVKACAFVVVDLLEYILNLVEVVAEEGRPDMAKKMLRDSADLFHEKAGEIETKAA